MTDRAEQSCSGDGLLAFDSTLQTRLSGGTHFLARAGAVRDLVAVPGRASRSSATAGRVNPARAPRYDSAA